jgi:hypothetical protein
MIVHLMSLTICVCCSCLVDNEINNELEMMMMALFENNALSCQSAIEIIIVNNKLWPSKVNTHITFFCYTSFVLGDRSIIVKIE